MWIGDGNVDDHTSTTAYIIFLGPNPISWLSQKQRPVVWSSINVEYRAMATNACEVMWLINLLTEFHVPMPTLSRLLCEMLELLTCVQIVYFILIWNTFLWTTTLWESKFKQTIYMFLTSLWKISLQTFLQSLFCWQNLMSSHPRPKLPMITLSWRGILRDKYPRNWLYMPQIIVGQNDN